MRGHCRSQDYAAAHPAERGTETPATRTSAEAPGASPPNAPPGYADPVGHQSSPVAGDERPPFALLLAVDDATGCVLNALFRNREDSHNYFLLMQGILQRRGIPLALYTDRHPVFKRQSEYQPAGTPTNFGRAMGELGTQMIFALSAHAKGRVEQTAGTFQDRLMTELRPAGATTIEQA